jgi:hypothetical protein
MPYPDENKATVGFDASVQVPGVLTQGARIGVLPSQVRSTMRAALEIKVLGSIHAGDATEVGRPKGECMESLALRLLSAMGWIYGRGKERY